MTKIWEGSKCLVNQEQVKETYKYVVMANNNIALFESLKAVEALKYAEWFEKKSNLDK